MTTQALRIRFERVHEGRYIVYATANGAMPIGIVQRVVRHHGLEQWKCVDRDGIHDLPILAKSYTGRFTTRKAAAAALAEYRRGDEVHPEDRIKAGIERLEVGLSREVSAWKPEALVAELRHLMQQAIGELRGGKLYDDPA